MTKFSASETAKREYLNAKGRTMKPTKKEKHSLKKLVRGLFRKDKSVTEANKKQEKEQTTMEIETKKDENTKVDETVEKKGGDGEVVETEKETTKTVKDEESAEKDAETAENEGEENPQPVVEEVPETGNGVRVEDLITKDEFHEYMAGVNAKIEAILAENKDLKEENAKLREKYEDNGDFGVGVSQGGGVKSDEYAESFDNYSKPYMK